MRRRSSNRRFFYFVLAVVLVGFFIFSSAALGLLNRDGASYGRVVSKQFIILIASVGAMILTANFDYHRLRRLALPVFLAGLLLSALVFVPELGFSSGGARRWLSIGSRTFQPAEFLKLGFVIYLAAWLARPNARLADWRYGLLPFLILVGLAGTLLVSQPDLGTFSVLLAAALAMFFVAGARWRHLLLLGLAALAIFSGIIAAKPYARERIITFLKPNENQLTTSYQINQSLITIGSGGWFGRGFGQSIQKFNYLPEPIGDSIFAVAAEEFGLIGAWLLIMIFVVFVWWGIVIAIRTTDRFGRLLVVGIVMLLGVSAFLNIGSMLGLLPLTGIPLVFVSHGGSSLLFSLIGCGIILNVAKRYKVPRVKPL